MGSTFDAKFQNTNEDLIWPTASINAVASLFPVDNPGDSKHLK